MKPDDQRGRTDRTAEDLAQLTKAELSRIARKHHIHGRSRMTKEELVASLARDDPSAPEPTATTESIIEIPDLHPIDQSRVTDDAASDHDATARVAREPDIEIPVPMASSSAADTGAISVPPDDTPKDTGVSDPGPHERPTTPSARPPWSGLDRRPVGRARSDASTIGSLYRLDDVPTPAIGKVVFGLIVTYIVMNRLIADRFVLPLGTSIRLYEVVLVLVGFFWVLWMITEPHPMPYGMPGVTGLILVVVVGLAPFVHALSLNAYEANGAERGLFRMVVFVTLFLACYHIALRLKQAMTLLAIVIASTVGQAAFALYEFVTQQPVKLLDDLATSIGLIPDPLSVRLELDGVFHRTSGLYRAVTTAPHPIVLSSVIAVGVLLCGVWLLYTNRLRGRIWLGIAASLLLIGLPLANSRTGYVILVALAIPVAFLVIEKLPSLILWSIPLILAGAIAFAVSPETPRLLLNSFTDPGDDPNTVVRIERFQRLPELIDERPYLGAGYLTFDPQIQFFDNAYNLALVELGIIGLASVLMFFFSCLVRCWVGTIHASRREAMLPIAGVIGVLALLAGGATFDAWTFDQFFPTCLILIGLGLGRSAVILRRDNAEPVFARSVRAPDLEPARS